MTYSLLEVLHRNLISPGVVVSIVLKADQRTGRQTQGIVADVLTRHDHPRGIKVRLQDGQVGRVASLTSSAAASQHLNSLPQSQSQLTPRPAYIIRAAKPKSRTRMSQHNNPWQDEESRSPNNPWGQQQGQGQPQYHENNPWGQQQGQGQPQNQGHNANYYQAPSGPPPSHNSQQQQSYSQHGHMADNSFQPQHPNRSQTDAFLPQGQERSEQLETMQNYESRAPQSQEDKDQATLQREYPNVDSSLIAALYSDNKDVAEVREMLQELARGS